MSRKNTQPVALSRYRQVRVTLTQELSGRVSYSVYAKPLNATWQEQHCMVRHAMDHAPVPLLTTEDVIGLLVTLLQQELLPGID